MLTRKKKRSYLTCEEVLKKTGENKALMLPQNMGSNEVEYRVEGGGEGDEGFQGEKEGALHQAIVKGDVESVKVILGGRVLADVNLITCCTSSMKTPLCCAVTCGNVEIVGVLVECGADVNLSCGPNKDTPLHMAMEMESKDNTVAMLQLLLKLGAVPDAKDGKGETALHKAAKSGDPDCVAILLNFGADSSEKDCLKRTPLHYVVLAKGTSCKANLECVRLLLEDSRININGQDTQGYTALHLSTGNENSKCAALLLKHGSDVTLRTSTGITALSMLARNLPDVMSCLVDRFNGAITIPNHCDPSDPNCEIKMDFSALLPKLNTHLSSPLDKPSKIRQKKETELLTCLVNTGNKKLLAHPLSSTFLLLKWRRVRKFFLASLLFQMMIVALFTVFIVEVYLIKCPYTREPASSSHSLSKRHAHAHPNPHPNPRARPSEDQASFHWFRVVPSKKKHKIPETTAGSPVYPQVNFPSTPAIAFGAYVPRPPPSPPAVGASSNSPAGRSNKTTTNFRERPAGAIAPSAVVPEGPNESDEELESVAAPPASGSFAENFDIRKMVPTPPTQPEVEEELTKCSLNWPLYLIWLLLIICICVMALQEIFQLVHSPRRYVISSENWAQWLLIASVMLTSWIRSDDGNGNTGAGIFLEYWQYPTAACGILIAWALILFQVGRFPSLGLYVEMLGKVAANFGIFILAYACLLIAFALSFCVLFPEHPPFSSVPLSILKVFTMMVGEVDYEDLFYSEERSHDPILFPITAHLLFGAFVLIMTIVLMNLLVGLAVSDIQGLQRGAKLDRLSRQTALIARFESFIISKKLQTLLPTSLISMLQENSLLALSSDSADDKLNWILYFRPNDPRDRTIPKDIKQESLNLITSSHFPLPRQPYFYHQNVSKDESVTTKNFEYSYSKKAKRSVSSISHLHHLKNKSTRHSYSTNRSNSNNSNDSFGSTTTDNTKALLDNRLNQVETKLENLERGINSILELLNAHNTDTKL